MNRASRVTVDGRVRTAWGAPATIVVLTVAGAVQTHQSVWVAAGLGLVVLVTGWILVRTDTNRWRLIVGLAVLAAALLAACWGEPRNFGWFGMCVVAGWAALALPVRWAITAGAVLAALFASMLFLVSVEPGWMTWTFGVALTTGAFVFVRRERELTQRLRVAQSELADRARADERHRIAREMHDLVGHSLTGALLHLGGARLALDEDLDAAGQALAEAEHATRSSLSDLRSTVGLLRHNNQAVAVRSQEIADLPALIDTYRNAGAHIDLELRGDVGRIPADRALVVYRIVQESLTNAVRHGDGGPIHVQLTAGADRLTVIVCNRRRRGGRIAAGTGIAAMTERVEALGGTLTAAADASDWRVEAVIPA